MPPKPLAKLGGSTGVFAALCLSTLCLVGCQALSDRPLSERIERLDTRGDQALAQGHYQRAGRDWRQALALTDSPPQPERVSSLRLKLARLHEIMGDYDQALEHALIAFNRATSAGLWLRRAEAQSVLGILYRRRGEVKESRAYAAAALKYAEDAAVASLQSEALRNLGALAQDGGELDVAADYDIRALRQARRADDPVRQAEALNQLGGLERERGLYADALDYYQQSLAIRTARGDLAGQSRVLGNLCLVFANLNQIQQALGYCRRSLNLARQIGDQAREANNLNNLAGIYRQLGDDRKALDYERRSLTLKRRLGDHAGVARSLGNLGDLYRERNDDNQALRYYRDALALKQALGDRSGVSATEYRLGRTYLLQGHHQQARQHFEQALRLQLSIGQPELLWRLFDGLATLHAATGNPALAIFMGKQAVNTLQQIRTGLSRLDQALQASFLRDKTAVYHDLAALLIQQGRILEAQQILDLLKQEEYLEFVRRSGSSTREPAGLTRIEQAQFEEYLAISTHLAALNREHQELHPLRQRTPDQEQRLTFLQAELTDSRRRFTDFLNALEKIFGQLGDEDRQQAIEAKHLRRVRALQGTLSALGDGTVLLHYLVLPDRVQILLTSGNTKVPPLARQVTLARSELECTLWQLRDALSRPPDAISVPLITPCSGRPGDLTPAEQLHAWLIQPVLSDLQQLEAKVLMLYLDDSLRYLPFAALSDGRRYLAQRYAVVIYTAAAESKLKDVPRLDWRVGGLGLSESRGDQPALPAVAAELDAIIRTDSSDTQGIYPGRIFLNQDFTRQRFEQLLDGDYSVLHIASHFVLRPGRYEQSFLLLGQGELTLREMAGFDFNGLDLLTLSACHTAVAGQGRGREVEGLGTLAQNQGAKSVLATLWSVADTSTGVFMQQFYRNHADAGLRKALALQKTQQTFIAAGQTAALPAQYAHPYYWAPFILMGNWL